MSTPIDTQDLWRWVDRLTLPTRQRIRRRPPGSRKAIIEYIDIPSLWTQLLTDVESSAAGGGHRAGGTGSRAPLNLAKIALAQEISDTVVDALISYELRPRVLVRAAGARPTAAAVRLHDAWGKPAVDPDLAGRLTERAARRAADHQARADAARLRHNTSSDLRQLAAHVVTLGERDPLTWWADRYRLWATRIETELGDDEEGVDIRPAPRVPGVGYPPCPACGVARIPYDRDGETFHDPALVVRYLDGQVQHVTCRACLTGWWRGDGLNELTGQLSRPVVTTTTEEISA